MASVAATYPVAGSSSTPPPYAVGSSSSSSGGGVGQTRSRTLLFLSYRDSVARSSRPTSTAYADDPLQADTEHLLPSHSTVTIDAAADQLPPKWMDVSDNVDALLASIRPRMDSLARLHEKHLRPGFTDKSAEEKQIESLALSITHDFRRASRLVAALASYTQHLIRSSKQANSDATVRQIALAQNAQTALATRVQDLSGAFRKQQSLYLRRMKGMEVRDHDIRAARGLAPSRSTRDKGKDVEFRDSELAVREDMELSQQQLSSPNATSTSLLLFDQQESAADLDIQQRSREINEIAKSIQELAHLFTDLQTLVIDQGTMLDRIDYNVELMSRELDSAVKELQTATTYQRRSGRRLCILFLCLLIALLIAIIIIKPFWRLLAPSPSPSHPPPPSIPSPP